MSISVETLALAKKNTKQAVEEAVTSVYKYKGSVETFNDLPTSGQKVGDVYNVADEAGKNYAWDGSNWDALGIAENLGDVKFQGEGLIETQIVRDSSNENDIWEGSVYFPSGTETCNYFLGFSTDDYNNYYMTHGVEDEDFCILEIDNLDDIPQIMFSSANKGSLYTSYYGGNSASNYSAVSGPLTWTRISGTNKYKGYLPSDSYWYNSYRNQYKYWGLGIKIGKYDYSDPSSPTYGQFVVASIEGTFTYYTMSEGMVTKTINQNFDDSNKVDEKVQVAKDVAQAAYNQANSAFNQGNSAYSRANTAYNQANTAYNQANAAYNRANDAYNAATNVQSPLIPGDNIIIEDDVISVDIHRTSGSQFLRNAETVRINAESAKKIVITDLKIGSGLPSDHTMGDVQMSLGDDTSFENPITINKGDILSIDGYDYVNFKFIRTLGSGSATVYYDLNQDNNYILRTKDLNPVIDKVDSKADKSNSYTKTETNNLLLTLGDNISVSIDTSNYTMNFSLKNNTTVLSTASISLPVVSIITSAAYDDTNKEITLTLENGNTLVIPVNDLIDGLVNQNDFNAAIANISNDLTNGVQESKNYTDNKLETLGDISFEATGLVEKDITFDGNNDRIIYSEYNEMSKAIPLENLTSNEILINCDGRESLDPFIGYAFSNSSNSIGLWSGPGNMLQDIGNNQYIYTIPDEYNQYKYFFLPLTHEKRGPDGGLGEKEEYFINPIITYTTLEQGITTKTINQDFYDKEDVDERIPNCGIINDSKLKFDTTKRIKITPLVGQDNDEGSFYYKKGTQVHIHINIKGMNGSATVWNIPQGYKPNMNLKFIGGGLYANSFAHFDTYNNKIYAVPDSYGYAIGDLIFDAVE